MSKENSFFKICFNLSIFLFLTAVIILFVRLMLDFSYSTDFPWILRSGYFILENKKLPAHDIFSWTFSNKPWMLYQWLFETGIALRHKLLGERILIHSFIIFVSLIYLFIPILENRSKKIPTIFTIFISSLCLISSTLNISLRPMVMTAFFLLVQYILLSHYNKKDISFKVLLVILIPMYILWGNIHMGVVLGLLSLSLMAIGDFLEGYKQNIKPYAGLILTGFVSSLINPYGAGIYKHLVQISSAQYLNKNIIELQSPSFHQIQSQLFLILFLIFIFLIYKTRKSFSVSEILHIVVFTVLTLFAQRFLVWSCVFYAVILPGALSQLFGSSSSLKCYSLKTTVFLPLISMVVLMIFVPGVIPSYKKGECTDLANGIKAYKKLRLPTDRLFNDPIVGSCSLAISPEQKVFIDTRFDFYGQEFSKQVREVCFLKTQKIKEFLNQWQINTIVIQSSLPLNSYLNGQKDFKKIYEDKYLSIYRK